MNLGVVDCHSGTISGKLFGNGRTTASQAASHNSNLAIKGSSVCWSGHHTQTCVLKP